MKLVLDVRMTTGPWKRWRNWDQRELMLSIRISCPPGKAHVESTDQNSRLKNHLTEFHWRRAPRNTSCRCTIGNATVGAEALRHLEPELPVTWEHGRTRWLSWFICHLQCSRQSHSSPTSLITRARSNLSLLRTPKAFSFFHGSCCC